MEPKVWKFPIAVCPYCGGTKFRIAVEGWDWDTFRPYCTSCSEEWKTPREAETGGEKWDIGSDQALGRGEDESNDVVSAASRAANETIAREVDAGMKRIKEAMDKACREAQRGDRAKD